MRIEKTFMWIAAFVLSQLLMLSICFGLEKEVSLITREPIGELAVAVQGGNS